MEKFSLTSIKEPCAFTSHDPIDMYNNILVFIVTNSNPSHPAEMHIFQVKCYQTMRECFLIVLFVN